MYGTVARVSVKPGSIEGLKGITIDREQWPKGAIAFYAFQMDADPNEVYMVAVFESQETYVANAESPEQHARYQQMMEYFEAEPEWHDGQIVYAETAGG